MSYLNSSLGATNIAFLVKSYVSQIFSLSLFFEQSVFKKKTTMMTNILLKLCIFQWAQTQIPPCWDPLEIVVQSLSLSICTRGAHSPQYTGLQLLPAAPAHHAPRLQSLSPFALPGIPIPPPICLVTFKALFKHQLSWKAFLNWAKHPGGQPYFRALSITVKVHKAPSLSS